MFKIYGGYMSKKKKSKVLKIILFIITLTICIAVAGGTYIYQSLSELSENSQLKDSVTNKEKDIVIEKNENDSINILALGVDIGDPTSNSENDPKRTDTMILIHYNPVNESVNVVFYTKRYFNKNK
jgi:anionic cell wall polymer biosynthesis LytR-Cps2A-Psr (LCP) family protein